jgi:hypothetical protein
MKIALCIDSLLLRDDSTFLFELVLNLFPNSEIYTIAHKRGGILGQVETRPIVSSFLSHKASRAEVLKKNFWILPSAVKGIPFHPSIEKVIVISHGYIHGLNFPKHIQSYLYLVNWDLIDQKNIGWQKLFAPYVNEWREKALTHYKKIAVSSEHLQQTMHLPNAEVIRPTFRTEEYPFVKDEDHDFMFDHHLLYTHGLSEKDFKKVVTHLISQEEMVRVMGPYEQWKGIQKEFPMVDFVGDHCEATAALYSHKAKAIWDFSESFFPAKAFGGFCTGRPVVVRETKLNKEYLSSGTHFLKSFEKEDLVKLHQDIEGSYLSHDRRALRRQGLRWNERLFKSRMAKFLDKNE